ncbi:MAG: alpha-2-macroglobulin family protein [Proteobacteria bacterium]|nr:alpha-2-macroglobulin family protein [Cystobacterineae bacterium]MCL2258860.1 alpha-2-macroglobulin family protein [Cystobacterineae bacterium]MCL2314836.1 alpha-2-macroglobulin family protein [Pseudomonadota bacterium]
MSTKRVFAFIWLVLVLVGCPKAKQEEDRGGRGVAAWQGVATGGNIEEIPEDVAFELLEAAERNLDGAPALALTFSLPLSPKESHSSFIQVFEMPEKAKTKKVEEYAYDEDGDRAVVDAREAVSAEAEDVETKGGTELKGGWVVGENPHLLFFPNIKPQARYVVYVKPEIKSVNKKVLGKEYRYSISTAVITPSYYFASTGMVLPAKQNGGLPVVTVNVPEVDVEFLRVNDDALPRFLDSVISGKKTVQTEDGEEYNYWNEGDNLRGSVSQWRLDNLHKMTTSVYRNRFVTEKQANKRSVTFLPIEGVKELKEPGVYIAVMAQPGRFLQNHQVSYFYVSDIGLSLHRYSNNAQVLVSSLTDGKAISGVSISWIDQNGKVLSQAETDNDGCAAFETLPENAQVGLARKGEQLSMLLLREPALDLSEYAIAGNSFRPIRLFAYSGRDLYRPGESFELSVLARDADGYAIPPQPIQALLRRPDGQKQWVATWQVAAERPGYYQQKIDLPMDAPTGRWSLELRNDPAEKQAGTVYKFSVEEFMPERMKLELQAEQQSLAQDESLQISVNGAYLYGAPASGNRVLGIVEFMPDTNPLRQTLPGFFFGDEDDKKLASRRELEEQTLDAEGNTSFTVDPSLSQSLKSPFKIRATISLLESGGRPVIRSIERTLWPTEEIVGLRPVVAGSYVRSNSLVEFEVVRANRQGKMLSTQGLQVRLFRENREYYWRYDDHRGWNSGYTETTELVGTFAVATASGNRGLLKVPVKYGRYRVEITGPNASAFTNYRFYAGWDAEQNERDGIRPDRVTLTFDKPSYVGGETAQLTVVAPHKGEAIIAVEADRLLWLKRVKIDSDKQVVLIPIDKEWKRHDIYVSATVLRPGNAGNLITPARALGIAPLRLDRSQRQLEVAMEAPEQVEPEKNFKVRIRVPQAKGKKAMVTLSAVDVGILNITNFKTPDPHKAFFGQLRYGVDLLDMYGRLIEKMVGKKGTLKFGGDASMQPTKGVPQKIELVDLFSGPVDLNAEGEAQIGMAVPDFNGKLRLMAVVASDDSYGAADREITVAAPLIAEVAMPRFIGMGDKAVVALDLHNMSGQAQQLKLNLAGSTGLKFEHSERKLSLKDKEKTTLRFLVRAEGPPDLADVSLRVVGQGIEMERRFRLQIEAITAPQTDVTLYAVEAGKFLELKSIATKKGWHLTTENAGLAISNAPPIDIRKEVKGLLVYPYGCAEQTTSSSYPHVFVDEETAKKFDLMPFTRKQRIEMLDKSIARLASYQGPNGAFSLWGNASSYEYWLTAYVTQFLQDARAQGFAVPEDVYRKATDFLLKEIGPGVASLATHEQLSRNNSWSSAWELRNRHFGVLAYGAYILAQEQKVSLATLRQLYDMRSNASGGLALVHLGVALKQMGDETRAKTALEEGMTKVRDNNSWYDYGSDIRDTALSYALLQKHKLLAQIPNSTTLLLRLNELLKKKTYLSTQEQFAVFMAGRDFGETLEDKVWKATLFKGRASQELQQQGRVFASLTHAELMVGSRFENQSERVLYIQVAYSGYPKEAPAEGGRIALTRSYYDAEGKLLQPSALKAGALKTGDTVWVKLTVSAGHINAPNALVVDRIPAGLEIENTNLIEGETGSALRIDGDVPAEAMNDSRIVHREFRDDRFVAAVRLGRWWNNDIKLFYRTRVVTPGVFKVPPLSAEDMYNPEIRGSYGGRDEMVIDSAILNAVSKETSRQNSQ